MEARARTCTTDGCGKPHRARGLCSTHYNQLKPDRHQKAVVPCAHCQTPCVKDVGRDRRYAGLFCSLACRDAWRVATGNNPHPTAEASKAGREAARAVRESRRFKARARLRRAARGTRGSRWVAGACHRCGMAFTAAGGGDDKARYCSDGCAKRARGSRRRARERNAEVERYSRHAIFERDGWRCHICRRKVLRDAVVPDPKAPTIDHLLPLSKGGGDTPANVATAHFICNSIKSDGAGPYGDQLPLIG